MAILRLVQEGTTTVSAATNAATATLATTLLDTAKAFLVFGATPGTAFPRHGSLRGQITNTTTLTFTRSDAVTATAGVAMTVVWYVVEFLSGVSVQRGQTSVALATQDVTISSVTNAQTFVLSTMSSGGDTMGANDFARCKLGTGPTTTVLTVTAATGNAGILCEWQVVEFTDGTALVQTQEVSLASAVASGTMTLSPAVDTAATFVVLGYHSDDFTGNVEIGEALLRAVLTNSTTVTIDRSINGAASPVASCTVSAVTLTDGSRVVPLAAAMTSGETTISPSLSSAVDPARSIVYAAGWQNAGGLAPYYAADDTGVSLATLDLAGDGASVTLTRGLTGSVALDTSVFAVEFFSGEPPQVSAPDADLSLGGWTTQADGTTNLYATVDEAAADDGDYVQSPLEPAADVLELSLVPVGDSGVSTSGSHVLSYRYRKPTADAAQINLVVNLLAGGTVIATRSLSDIPDSWTAGEVDLTPAEIADFRANGGYADPRVQLIAEESA